MKKQNILLCAILSSISLSACNSTPVDSSSISTSQEASSEAYVESSKVEEVSSEIVSSEEISSVESIISSEEVSSEIVSSEEISSVESIISSEEVNSSNTEVDEYGYIKNDLLIEYESIDIGVNEKYNIGILYEDQTSIFDILVEDKDIVVADVDDCINGLKEGTTKLKFIVDDTYYDEVTINVKSEEYMNQNMKLDKGRLYGKTFTVFGDSISDVRVTAYPDNRPDFWCEQLVRKYNMTVYNEAISGATTGYCKKQIDQYPYFIDHMATNVVNLAKAVDEVKQSDFVFIFSGANDAFYETSIGEIGDINDNNYRNVSSIKGAYSYLIDKIRIINPNVKIVCLGVAYNSWSSQNIREEVYKAVQEVATVKQCKYIHLYSLWDGSNLTNYCPDGIHPQTAGYDLIVKTLMEE